MAEFIIEKRVVISADAAALAESVAARFLNRLAKCGAEGQLVHVSLTGGSMGSAVLAAAARHPRREKVDWSRVHVWWSDERFVRRGHEDRNDLQAQQALLDAVDIPAANIHTMGASDDGLDLDAAAERYAADLATFRQDDGTPWPSFDICFLGVGPDGHIASLFPDRPEILITDRVAVAVRDSPKPPPERISLTRPVINGSRRVLARPGGSRQGVGAGAGARGCELCERAGGRCERS